MGQSSFSYSLSRPYPFKWFSWIVVLSGLSFTVFFSFLNIAADGKILSVTYTTNPNQTFPQAGWMKAWPFRLADKVSASCQARDIPIGSEFFTDKLSLPYSLAGVWQPSTAGDQIASSMSYFNNTLEDCSINYVQIELLAEDRTAEQFGWSQWGPKISASATCSITIAAGLTMLNLSTEYDLLPTTVGDGQQSSFLKLEPKQKASLWWGASLISMYWIMLAQRMQDIRGKSLNTDHVIRKGSINLTPRLGQDIASPDFFKANYHFVMQTQSSGDVPIFFNSGTSLNEWARIDTYPNIWNIADIYGKSFYSAVLADLGQASTPNVLSNSSSALLQEYTKDFASFTWDVNATPGPARQSFDDVKAQGQTGPLLITPSTIHQQYLCQIPQFKSLGSLVIAVVIADLVFLQTLWKILTVATTWYVGWSYPTAKYCEGCIMLLGDGESHELEY